MERLVGGGLLEELGGRLATSEPAEDARSWLDETPLSGSLQRRKKRRGKGHLTKTRSWHSNAQPYTQYRRTFRKALWWRVD